jgi:uncharacterized protein YgiM (DUF1202 family)
MDREAAGSKLERPLGPGEALVFSKQNYEGQEQRVTADTENLDFPAASLKVGPTTGVTVFLAENYQGPSQELTTDLNSFGASRLQGQPKSLKIWPAAGKPFTGRWAIGIKAGEESAEARYLSAGLDGRLTTNPRVSERESFRITEGLTGWASAKYLALVQPLPPDANKPFPDQQTRDQYRATAKLNVREGPGTTFKAIGYLQGNEIAEVLESIADKSWLRICRKPDAREVTLGRRRVTLSLPDIQFMKPASTLQPPPLFVDDLENLTLVNEPEVGFRKFSLLSKDNRWICYNPVGNYFLTSAKAEERTIFCQSIKLAEDETQVGELLQGEAALYENAAYWGRAWVFYTDYADFERVLNLNEAVSSIQLGPLTGVTIYRAAQYTAEDKEKGKQDVTSSLSSLAQEQVGENQISSLQLWRIVPPGGLGVSVQCCLSQDFHFQQDPQESRREFTEYSAYRTTLRLPPTVQTVEVWATDQTEIEVDDEKYPVSEDQLVVLKPNLAGCLVITTDAIGDLGGSLRAPGLKIRTDAMQPHERIVIFPDQEVHAKLAAKLEEDPDALWKANYKDEKGITHYVIDQSTDPKVADAQHKNAADAQEMIKRVMSTVKYSEGKPGTRVQTISAPDELHKKGWVLYFRTYIVTAETLYVRKDPGREFESVGFLQKNDIVEPLEFKPDASWIRVRRLSDGLTGWSSSKYLKTGERYRVTGKRVHLRAAPGTGHPSLGYLESNEIVTCIGVNEDGTWRQIRRGDGLTGWSYASYFALLPSPPLPPVSGPSQAVKFQEMSQGEVQALLAMAQSPDMDLAQGIFDDIAGAVKKAVSITVSKVKDSLAIIVEMSGKAVVWVVDTAEKVIAFLEGIFQKIGAFIKDVIQWLRFTFNWDEILETRDYLSKTIDKALEDLECTQVEQAKHAVASSAASMKQLMIDRLDDAILSLDPEQSAAETSALSSIISKIKSTGIPDALDWILSKVLSALSNGAGGAFGALQALLEAVDAGDGNETAEEANLRQFWEEKFIKGLEAIVVVPAGVVDVIVTLAKDPDNPLPVLAELLKLFRDLLDKLIDFGVAAILGLLDSLGYVVKKFSKIITAPIRIPFISDLIDWIIGLAETKSPELPALLDVLTLILAIPVTIISKAAIDEVPFKHVPVLAQGTSGLEIAVGVIGCCGAVINGALDTLACRDADPDKEDTKDSDGLDILEFLCVLCAISAWRLPLIEREQEPKINSQNSMKPSERWLTIYEGLMWDVDLFCMFFGTFSGATKVKRLKRASPAGAVAATVVGVGHLVLMIWKAKNDEGVRYAIADLLTTAPEILSFILAIPAAAKNPWAMGCLVGSDVVAAGASIEGIS